MLTITAWKITKCSLEIIIKKLQGNFDEVLVILFNVNPLIASAVAALT